jgi:D-sedoheptulose 7-phosphate isomerase
MTIGFTGTRGESMRTLCDHLLVAPSDEAAVIQQVHMMAAHAICGEVERVLMNKGKA